MPSGPLSASVARSTATGGSGMLRARLNEALKEAIKAKDGRRIATLRLILAALKDRDIAARSKGQGEGIGEDEILQMLQGMIRQRRESIEMYEKGGRPELAAQEAEEIAIIEAFLPRQLDEAETAEAVRAAIAETGAQGLKDMGRVMGPLRQRYAGRMDFAQASRLVRETLG